MLQALSQTKEVLCPFVSFLWMAVDCTSESSLRHFLSSVFVDRGAPFLLNPSSQSSRKQLSWGEKKKKGMWSAPDLNSLCKILVVREFSIVEKKNIYIVLEPSSVQRHDRKMEERKQRTCPRPGWSTPEPVRGCSVLAQQWSGQCQSGRFTAAEWTEFSLRPPTSPSHSLFRVLPQREDCGVSGPADRRTASSTRLSGGWTLPSSLLPC